MHDGPGLTEPQLHIRSTRPVVVLMHQQAQSTNAVPGRPGADLVHEASEQPGASLLRAHPHPDHVHLQDVDAGTGEVLGPGFLTQSTDGRHDLPGRRVYCDELRCRRTGGGTGGAFLPEVVRPRGSHLVGLQEGDRCGRVLQRLETGGPRPWPVLGAYPSDGRRHRRPTGRSTASWMSSSIRSAYASPLASHIFGYIEIGVKPGSVLISLRITSPSGVTNESTRERPSPPIASKALTAYSWIVAAMCSGRSAGASVRACEADRY